ncbi:hypothetical protein D3C84_694920 [compost metagenome]
MKTIGWANSPKAKEGNSYIVSFIGYGMNVNCGVLIKSFFRVFFNLGVVNYFIVFTIILKIESAVGEIN